MSLTNCVWCVYTECCWSYMWLTLHVCSVTSDSMDCSSLGSSVHGITLARILEWVAISFSRGSGFPGSSALQRLPAMRETWVWSLGQEDPLEKEMETHSSILAWRIPWMEEPGGLQYTGLQRVRHNWATSFHFISLHFTSLHFTSLHFFSRGSPWQRAPTCISWISCIGRRILYQCLLGTATVTPRKSWLTLTISSFFKDCEILSNANSLTLVSLTHLLWILRLLPLWFVLHCLVLEAMPQAKCVYVSLCYT